MKHTGRTMESALVFLLPLKSRKRKGTMKGRDSLKEKRTLSIDMKRTAPIGVFDSGVGGLTVAREIMRHLPNENIVYFGDTARVPYGSKSRDNIIRYSRQIINFLKTKNVKAIVIACNTASALALEVVREEFDIPIIGVVEPGARAALEATKTKKIGVIGTEATIRSAMYEKIIQGFAKEATVVGKACPLFVPLVEEGFAKHKVTEDIIDYYLASFMDTDIDSLILGCTHYPLLRSRIKEYVGEKITLVNPAYETAMDLRQVLKECDMENTEMSQEHATYSFYVSDAADKFKQFANSILPYDIETTKQINIEEY